MKGNQITKIMIMKTLFNSS